MKLVAVVVLISLAVLPAVAQMGDEYFKPDSGAKYYLTADSGLSILYALPKQTMAAAVEASIGGDTLLKRYVWQSVDTGYCWLLSLRTPLPVREHDVCSVYSDVLVVVDGERFGFTFEQFMAIIRRMKNYREGIK